MKIFFRNDLNSHQSVETLKFIKDNEIDWCGFHLATPLRGSELYDICIKNNYIKKTLRIGENEDQMNNYIINAGTPPEELSKKTYIMNLDVNFVNNYRMKIGDYETAAKCFQSVINITTNHAFAYYYLAKCNINSDENMNDFIRIINTDQTWKKYALYFNLI